MFNTSNVQKFHFKKFTELNVLALPPCVLQAIIVHFDQHPALTFPGVYMDGCWPVFLVGQFVGSLLPNQSSNTPGRVLASSGLPWRGGGKKM